MAEVVLAQSATPNTRVGTTLQHINDQHCDRNRRQTPDADLTRLLGLTRIPLAWLSPVVSDALQTSGRRPTYRAMVGRIKGRSCGALARHGVTGRNGSRPTRERHTTRTTPLRRARAIHAAPPKERPTDHLTWRKKRETRSMQAASKRSHGASSASRPKLAHALARLQRRASLLGRCVHVPARRWAHCTATICPSPCTSFRSFEWIEPQSPRTLFLAGCATAGRVHGADVGQRHLLRP